MVEKHEILTIWMKICGFEKNLGERKLTDIWKWKALNSAESYVTHVLTDFIHDADGCFSESHDAHLFFTVKKLGNWAKNSFPHLGMMCNQELFNNCGIRTSGFSSYLCFTRSHLDKLLN